MFQENALYPWLTLAQNVALALEFQKTDRQKALRQAHEWLSKVNLKGFEAYYTHQVSGGMRQRADLARALLSHPNELQWATTSGALSALPRTTLHSPLRPPIPIT